VTTFWTKFKSANTLVRCSENSQVYKPIFQLNENGTEMRRKFPNSFFVEHVSILIFLWV